MSVICKRPAVSFCIMMIAGILAAYLSDSVILVVSLFLLISACFFVFGRNMARGFFVPSFMLVFFLIGAFEFLAYNHYRLEIFSAYGGKEVTVRGFVASEPEVKGNKVTYVINATAIREGYIGAFSDIKGKILLTTLAATDASFFDYGSEVVFEGMLTQPKGARNPGGFDYRSYLAQKGVGASVFAYPYFIETMEGKGGNFIVRAGMAARNRIVHVIENSLPRQQAGLLNGMLIGYKKGLSEEVREVFGNAGLLHIVAVSGANVAFLMLPLSFLLKLLRVPKRIANILVIMFLFFFMFVAGFEPSVFRAVVMATVFLLSAALYREPDTYSAMAVSCIILLAINPCMLFNIGFQLSYGATLGIVMLSGNIENTAVLRIIRGKTQKILSATLAAQLGVLPVTLIHFNKISVISIIPNLLAAPMLELITILGMLMAVLGQFSLAVSRLVGYLNCNFLSLVLYIAKWASDMPFSVARTATPTLALAAAYYFVVWFLLWYKPLKGIRLNMRHTAAVLSFAAVAALIGYVLPGRLVVVFLDVGQGDSAFIRTYTGRTVIIDGGGSDTGADSRIGENTVIPFLLDYGATSLDAVIATHPHGDHTQGLEDVLEQMKVARLIIPSLVDESYFDRLLAIAGKRNIPVSRCSKGDVIKLDNRTSIRVLSPEAGIPVEEDSLNNVSLVLKLDYGETSVLFTGDAETEAEERLMEGVFKPCGNGTGLPDGVVVPPSDGMGLPHDGTRFAKDVLELEADVLKVAHHGSITSTGREFLEAVNPEAAIISVGKNKYGHPSQHVLDLLREMEIKCFRTDECGAVILTSDGKSIRLRRTIPPGR
ncbi:MAG: DNA internalization-related competence protein ComEC/Rec2 [Bacillota bacterium]